MNSASHIAEKPLPPFNLSEYPPPSVTDEEWNALGINPFKDVEAEKHACMESLFFNINHA